MNTTKQNPVVNVRTLTDEALEAELVNVRTQYEAQRARFKAAIATLEDERTRRAREAKAPQGPTAGAGTSVS